jgi:hypothetical protein
MRVVATASNGTPPDDTRASEATAVITAPPVAEAGTPFVSAPPPPVGPQSTTLLTPFPVVRMQGALVRGGARVLRFTVQAPAGARIDVSCGGRGCPRKSLATVSTGGVARLKAFERFLPAGVKLTVRVSRADAIGKYTTLTIRAHGGPLRTDRCLPPGRAAPVRCGA